MNNSLLAGGLAYMLSRSHSPTVHTHSVEQVIVEVPVEVPVCAEPSQMDMAMATDPAVALFFATFVTIVPIAEEIAKFDGVNLDENTPRDILEKYMKQAKVQIGKKFIRMLGQPTGDSADRMRHAIRQMEIIFSVARKNIKG